MSGIKIKSDITLEKQKILFLIYVLILSAYPMLQIDKIDKSNLELSLIIPVLIIALVSVVLFIFIWTNKFKVMFSQDAIEILPERLELALYENEVDLVKPIEKINLAERLESSLSKNEVDLVNPIKKINLPDGKKSTYYNKENDLNEILRKLPEFDCDIELFEDLLLGYEIPADKKIKSTLDKIGIIRFVVIIFELKRDYPNVHNQIKAIIDHYFLEKESMNPYKIQNTASEVSQAFNELLDESSILNGKKKKLDNIFSIK